MLAAIGFQIRLTPAFALCCATVGPLWAQSVVDTYPNPGETDVSSNLGQIQVAFDRPMMPGSWSLLKESTSSFPEYESAPRFSADRQSFYLDCKLQPNTTYVLWLNHGGHNKFRDITGRSAQPFRLAFRTAAAGKKAIYSLGDDPIVEQNTLNLANKEAHVRYTREQLAALGPRDKLTLVAHGSPTTLGGMSPDELTGYLKQSGIAALDTLSLKGCESAEFAKELMASLDRANLPVNRITARLGKVTIAETGNTLVTANDGELLHQAPGSKIEITRDGVRDVYAGREVDRGLSKSLAGLATSGYLAQSFQQIVGGFQEAEVLFTSSQDRIERFLAGPMQDYEGVCLALVMMYFKQDTAKVDPSLGIMAKTKAMDLQRRLSNPSTWRGLFTVTAEGTPFIGQTHWWSAERQRLSREEAARSVMHDPGKNREALSMLAIYGPDGGHALAVWRFPPRGAMAFYDPNQGAAAIRSEDFPRFLHDFLQNFYPNDNEFAWCTWIREARR